MKPIIAKTYVQAKIIAQENAPCEIEICLIELPLASHPAIPKIGNRRQRRRWIKHLKRNGITHFASHEYHITPKNNETL
jgi:hypothetical protein